MFAEGVIREIEENQKFKKIMEFQDFSAQQFSGQPNGHPRRHEMYNVNSPDGYLFLIEITRIAVNSLLRVR